MHIPHNKPGHRQIKHFARWSEGVKISAVKSPPHSHSLHAYFNTSPESPDRRYILFFSSARPAADRGNICITERLTGKIKTLAEDITVEDAHRQACQQWICNGKKVVFQDIRNRKWVIVSVHTDTLKEEILAEGRQLGFGRAGSNIVALSGLHWNPGHYKDVELLNVETGEIQTAVKAEQVSKTYGEWISRTFGKRNISVFFPVLSPDLTKIIFKLSTVQKGKFRDPEGSLRKGLFCYDLNSRRFLFMREHWGHPSWHPDSKKLINVEGSNLILIECKTGLVEAKSFINYDLSKGHPSFSSQGDLFTCDFKPESKNAWAVGVGNIRNGKFIVLHKFDNTGGASSWRPAHPHPVFGGDNTRIYFNVNSHKYTQLYVAETGSA
jgi:hypothetical protein